MLVAFAGRLFQTFKNGEPISLSCSWENFSVSVLKTFGGKMCRCINQANQMPQVTAPIQVLHNPHSFLETCMNLDVIQACSNSSPRCILSCICVFSRVCFDTINTPHSGPSLLSFRYLYYWNQAPKIAHTTAVGRHLPFQVPFCVFYTKHSRFHAGIINESMQCHFALPLSCLCWCGVGADNFLFSCFTLLIKLTACWDPPFYSLSLKRLHFAKRHFNALDSPSSSSRTNRWWLCQPRTVAM